MIFFSECGRKPGSELVFEPITPEQWSIGANQSCAMPQNTEQIHWWGLSIPQNRIEIPMAPGVIADTTYNFTQYRIRKLKNIENHYHKCGTPLRLSNCIHYKEALQQHRSYICRRFHWCAGVINVSATVDSWHRNLVKRSGVVMSGTSSNGLVADAFCHSSTSLVSRAKPLNLITIR